MSKYALHVVLDHGGENQSAPLEQRNEFGYSRTI
ncbi:hypothetical protein D039_2989A, partial [Vibrio parahaemolyticus EKP-028]